MKLPASYFMVIDEGYPNVVKVRLLLLGMKAN
jgi:hypothetical protein